MKQDEYRSVLEEIGFTDKQALVYIALLKLGETTISKTAKAANLKRPTTYVIVDQLEKLSFVARRRDGKKDFIRALSPYSILGHSENVLQKFKDNIPSLLSLNNQSSSAPHISLIAGPEDVERSMKARLLAKSELLFWADNNLQFTHQALAHGSQLRYMEERIKRGIWTRGLIPYEPDWMKLDDANLRESQQKYLQMKREGSSELREFVFIERAKVMQQTEIWVYDNIVEFFSSIDFIGARVEHDGFANSMRAIFMAQLTPARRAEEELITSKDRKFLDGV